LILNLTLASGLLAALGATFVLAYFGNKETKKYLAPIFLLLSFEILYFYAELHANNFFEILAFFLSDGLGSLMGVLIWLYVRAITDRPLQKSTIYYHFIYPVLNLFVVIPIGISIIMKSWVSTVHHVIAEHYNLYISLENFIIGIYLVVSLKVLKQHRISLRDHFSQFQNRSLNWLRVYCQAGISLIILDTLTTIYERVFGDLSWNVGLVTVVALCGCLFYLGYHGLKQTKVILFEDEKDTPQNDHPKHPKERTYLRKFQDSEIAKYREEAIEAMTFKKLFLKPELILPDLAMELGLTTKQTTELLNTELQTNFYDFVNQYRVEEAKGKLHSGEYDHLTLLAIGLEAGFQSKSSFNRVFKKITGLSPSEYKKKHKQ